MPSPNPRALAPLKDAGYELIPLRGREKAPRDPRWTTRPYKNEDQVAHMEAGNNVGVRLRATDLVVDVDPRNFKDVWDGVDPFSELVLRLGLDPTDWPSVRTGGGGTHYYLTKPAVPVRDDLADFPGVEFKTLGRQVVAPGSVHPETERTYTWAANAEDLWCAPACPEALLEAIRRQSARASGAEAGVHTAEELAAMLEALDPEDFREHDDWLALMQACHHATAGAGREEFIGWSTGDPEYADHAGIIGRRWDSLHAETDGPAVTHRTLHKLLLDAGRGDAIPRPSAEDDFDAVADDEAPADARDGRSEGPLERMNREFCAVDMEGRFRVAYQRTDVDAADGRRRSKWVFATRQAFEDLHMHRKVERGGRAVPLAKAWLEWGQRRQADGVTFDPSADAGIVDGRLNLWTGFGCQPREGDWSHIRWLVEEALCGGDRAASEYVLDWIAWKVQNPDGLPSVALAFKGAKGTGKTTLGELVASLFGSHGLVLSRREQLTGQFTAYLGTACFALCDEVEFRHASGREDAALKKLITDRDTMIERKGVDATASTNRLGVMLATNGDVVVPASAGERRYAVLEVSEEWSTGDTAPRRDEARRMHALVHEQIRSGGREAFLHAMLARRVEGHPRDTIPPGAALVEQKVENLPLVERWFLSACEAGELPRPVEWDDEDEGSWEDFPQYTTYTEVADDLMRFARSEGVRAKRQSARAVLRALRPFGVLAVKQHRQVRAWRVPALPEVREAWARRLGGDPFG